MKKRILSALLAAAMAVSIAACGDGGEASQSGSGSSENSESEPGASSSEETAASANGVWDPYTPYEETVTFTKCRSKPTWDEGYTNGDTITNNPYTRLMEEKLNIKTEIAWETDSNTFNQKVSLAIASGDIPDMMVVDRRIYKQLVQNDLIQEMGEAYEKCISPFLRDQYDSYGDRIFEEATYDGKLMGIPGTQIYGQNFSVLWVRTDYLEKVNMEMPKTMEDVRKVAKAFIENDVSGTGNTMGISLSEKVYDKGRAFNADTCFFTDKAYPGWWIPGEDGKAVYGSTMPEMKTTLQTLRSMYEEGTLDQEFAVRKNEDRTAMVASGQAGMYFGTWWPDGSMGDSVVNDKDADWAAVVIAGPDGKLEVPEDDPVNLIVVVRKEYEHPEAIVKALNISYDAIRGVGDDGKAVYEDILVNCPNLGWGSCPIPLQVDSYDAIELLTDDLKQALEKGDKSAMKVQTQSANFDIIMKERENPHADAGIYNTTMARTIGSEAILPSYNGYISVAPMAYFGQTETMTSKWANLDKLEREMMVQIIMGEKPMEYFDEFVTQWYALGGQTITDEVNADMK